MLSLTTLSEVDSLATLSEVVSLVDVLSLTTLSDVVSLDTSDELLVDCDALALLVSDSLELVKLSDLDATSD
ncbi:hypothetical protein LEQ_0102 [Ligilactobacillus equi DPC 6820]|uniref:Uncharacterized protein n=1 Tax=Ligilactobacillus equi DPC 6820 TaxID=1392007 RepID=V7HV78_9LACO|nr:hypothetical protein LEQ_0102 [Ligilactobacillus equi DPC 6820]